MSDALLDSNVVVAGLVDTHLHHKASLALLVASEEQRYAIAAHSFSEAFNTLTRSGRGALFAYEPVRALAALESVRAVTDLLGLTPGQTFEAIRSFGQGGGVGPRLYDHLIGEVALVHGIPALITWNAGHMRSLFPQLKVITPEEAMR